MVTTGVVADVVGVEGVAEVLGQILGQIDEALVSIRRSSEHALNVDLSAEARHVQGLGRLVSVELVECLVPGGQQLPGGRVEVVAGLSVRVGLSAFGPLTPDRKMVTVEADLI